MSQSKQVDYTNVILIALGVCVIVFGHDAVGLGWLLIIFGLIT
jgi:hypothetical protein